MKLVCESLNQYSEIQRIKDLTKSFVRGNEDFMGFTDDDAEELIKLIKKHPEITEASIKWIEENNKMLYRGLKDDAEDEKFVTLIDSYTVSREIANEFSGGGSIISAPLEKIKNKILLAVEVVLHDFPKPKEDDCKEPDIFENEMLCMSYMIWEQKEVLVETS